MRVTIAAALASVAFGLFGCAASNEAGGALMRDDCVGSQCPLPNVAGLSAELFASGLTNQEFRSLPFDSTTRTFQLQTTPSVTLSGLIRLPAGVKLSDGVFVATRASRISGRPNVTYQANIRDEAEVRYSLELPPNVEGEQYSLRLSLNNRAVPPVLATVSLAQDTVLDFKIEVPENAIKISGLVTTPLGAGIQGIEVSGRDSATGELVTTVATTGLNGDYTLVVGQVGSGGIRLTAQLDDTLRLERTLSVVSGNTSTTMPVILQQPALPLPTPTTFRCVGVSAAGIDAPVVGAQVVASTEISEKGLENIAVHETRGITGPDGNVTLKLYRAVDTSTKRPYDAAILPPGDSPFRTTLLTLEASQTPGGYADLRVEGRAQVFGTLVDSAGMPIAAATIEPRRSTTYTTSAIDSLAAIFQPTVATDSDGKFIMYVDPGTYDFAISPKVGSGLPRFWQTTIEVAGATNVGTIAAPKAARLIGRLVDSSQMPKPSVTVRLYELPTENALCATDQCVKPARLQAELTSRADGTIDALLPAAPAAN